MTRETVSKYFFLNLDLDSDERFDLARFMLFDEDAYDPLASNMIDNIRNIKVGGRYTIQGEEGRPDLMSHRIYGNSQYWWILLLYNGMTSINDIVHGTEIRFPQLQALEDFYFNLKIEQNISDKEDL